MIRPSWTDTTAALARRAELAETAAQRMRDAEADFGHSERETQELFALVALSRARDAALLRAAGSALRRRAAGRSAPLWLSPSRVLPGEAAPRWWRQVVTQTDAGIWRAIPQPGPETALGQLDDPLVQEVAKGARLLQTSLVGYKGRDSSYEAFVPDGGPLQGRSVPPIPGLSPERSWKVNLLLGRGSGFRVKADRMDEFAQANQDRHAVWERARTYGAAVVVLLRAVA
ncbi:hypothetical protein [Kitasatospora purpeofusca]|uniref:hypothetical protein n=1 Tax=Kitasatospora purpeofusca TaxID=67352 RepID=UPI0036BE93D4